MRYQPEHKAETHRKIVKDASRRVRSEGITGAAVSAVMRDAGLTHGGFYKHFASKDDLLIEALSDAFQETAGRLAQAAEKSSRPEAAWKQIVKAYLNPEHCDHVERGCPLSALAPELARVDKAVKPRIAEQMAQYKSRMVPFMPGRRTADKERAFFLIFSTMIGAMEIARMIPKPAMREKVLATACEFLLSSF